MQLLYWFEKIRNPFLDFFFSAITYLGDEIALMLIAIVLFWCVNKRSGYYMLVSGFFGIIVNQILKLACKIPRPKAIDPNFIVRVGKPLLPITFSVSMRIEIFVMMGTQGLGSLILLIRSGLIAFKKEA